VKIGFSKKLAGGILTDIASHQMEQILYSGCEDAENNLARVKTIFMENIKNLKISAMSL